MRFHVCILHDTDQDRLEDRANDFLDEIEELDPQSIDVQFQASRAGELYMVITLTLPSLETQGYAKGGTREANRTV